MARNVTKFARVAIAALLAAGAASAAAEVLVVRSAGPSAGQYPAGRSLPDNARIQLQGGDTLILLSSRGTRTFRGPGTFSPSQAVTAGGQPVADANDRARIAAVRSAGLVPTSPTTIWNVDATQGGTMCLAGTEDVKLWRPDAAAATSLTIAAPDGHTHEVEWPAGSTTVPWPSEVAIAPGVAYELRQPGTAVPTQVTFKILEGVPDETMGIAEALIANECEDQLELLLAAAPAE